MEKDKQFIEAIQYLSETTEKWLHIKKILQEEIQAHQDIIRFIDKIVKEREGKISKLN